MLLQNVPRGAKPAKPQAPVTLALVIEQAAEAAQPNRVARGIERFVELAVTLLPHFVQRTTLRRHGPRRQGVKRSGDVINPMVVAQCNGPLDRDRFDAAPGEGDVLELLPRGQGDVKAFMLLKHDQTVGGQAHQCLAQRAHRHGVSPA